MDLDAAAAVAKALYYVVAVALAQDDAVAVAIALDDVVTTVVMVLHYMTSGLEKRFYIDQ